MKANLPLRYSRNLSHAYPETSKEGLSSMDQLPLKKSCTAETISPELEVKVYHTSEKDSCRTHPETRGLYFLTDQPWIRLCKECALNKALCGHQI